MKNLIILTLAVATWYLYKENKRLKNKEDGKK
jgi:hypothetical protein